MHQFNQKRMDMVEGRFLAVSRSARHPPAWRFRCGGTVRPVAVWASAIFGLLLTNASLCALGEESPRGPAGADHPGANRDHVTAERVEQQALLLQLDAPGFKERNEATRQLIASGAQCVPLLAKSLGADSREVRFRVAQMLRRQFSFDHVAPHLVAAVAEPYGSDARKILRDRALSQVSEVAHMENTKKLFAFWGTDAETLRRRIMFDLSAARGQDQVLSVVGPLIGLAGKAEVFNTELTSLKALSLHFDHQHSPGYLVAQILAQGLLQAEERKVAFAHDYIRAFELLVERMQAEGSRTATVRNEVVERANMSDGATSFLVRALDSRADIYPLLTEQLGIDAEMLRQDFFRGLAVRDTKECYRCVGKVHITDMLLEAMDRWPNETRARPSKKLVEGVVATVLSGDKPKALALLDAFEACSELQSRGSAMHKGLGRRLSQRLCAAALTAPDNRAFHPARAIHDRILRLVDNDVGSESELFPNQFVNRYLDGGRDATADQARLAIGRYARMLEQVKESGLDPSQPTVRRFLKLMCQDLNNNQQRLEAGAVELARLTRESRPLPAEERRQLVCSALNQWLAQIDE